MQILGKRSKVLLIAVAIAMLVTIGISFAMWDSMSTVKATSGNASTYANAKVGDKITFGNYYQTGNRINNDANAEYEKTPIEWIVVDKDERTGQLTLMSKYILACGSYFGNMYYTDELNYGWGYSEDTLEVGGITFNQAYVDSTVRAFLNNLERRDMGGDMFDATLGYRPSAINSTIDKTENGVFTKGTGLLTSIGFSNQRYFTYLNSHSPAANMSGFHLRADSINEIYYQRPINSAEYINRPATKGFYDEAFTDTEKSMIVPRAIGGYTGFRWPDTRYDMSLMSYVEGVVDKVWIPSATELNAMNGIDWSNAAVDSWTSPSEAVSSNVFEYFKNLSGDALKSALQATRTPLASDGKAGNYSIPVYDKGTSNAKTAIADKNSSDNYWTRSASSYWCSPVRAVLDTGIIHGYDTHHSTLGVRPCIILKY